MSGFDRRRVNDLLEADNYARGLGVEIVEVTGDEIVLGLQVTEAHANFLGLGHGGMVFSLADCAFSLASNSAGEAVAIDTHLVLTRACRPGDRLEARVRQISRGRTLGTYRTDVSLSEGKIVGLFTGTVYITPGQETPGRLDSGEV